MDAPNLLSSMAPTKARIRPTRKLIIATIPSAWGPHSSMTRKESAQRNCARPRSSLPRAVRFSPRKVNSSSVAFQPLSTRSPILCRNGALSTSCRASFFSGTAWASASKRRTPSGRPSPRNSTLRSWHNSAQSRIKATKCESQPVRPADSNDNDFTPGGWFNASRTTSTLGRSVCSRKSPESRTSSTPGDACSTTKLAFEAGRVIESSDWNAGASQFFKGAVGGEGCFAKMVLEHHPGVISAASVAADCVDPVAGCDQHPPALVLGRIADAAAYTRVPVARLFKTPDVVHHRGGCHRHDVPLPGGAKGDGVETIGEPEFFGREFPKEIPWQV